jgi:hypothetical protein
MKMTDWLFSIEDEALRNRVKKTLLVTGGSITSMFLNEDVNDYDVYISDMDVLHDLCLYYRAQSQKRFEIMDGRNQMQELAGLADDYSMVFDNAEDIESYRASAIRTLKPCQIKLLVMSGIKIENIQCVIGEDKKSVPKKYQPAFFSPNAISLTDDLQIVCRFTGDAKQIHETFDFIHATNYFTFAEGLVLNTDALASILSKQLRYQGSQYPLTSIIRMKKFIKRGWNISAGEILKMMFQVSELNLKDPDTLEEQLVGVDVAYFGTLIEILRGVDKEKINSSFLNTVIDKVFNEYEEEITL